jgi:hypothetical protein
MTEKEKLEESIAALEAQRAMLGNAVIGLAIAALRKQLAELTHSPAAELYRKLLA